MSTTKPDWLKIKLSNNSGVQKVENLLLDLNLNTVCREANCPNRGECYSKGTATFIIMGKNCSRNCKFCNVKSEVPEVLDVNEPSNLAEAVKRMKLEYVVITSVTRDDLEDGGAKHFAKTIHEVKKNNSNITIEALVSDMEGDIHSLETILSENPNTLNHNMETIPRLYREVRPEANYRRSLDVIEHSKKLNPSVKTKTGIMLGLGETKVEVLDVMRDLRSVDCDYLTLGQYLAPSKEHYPVKEYITPQEFLWYKEKALEMGFRGVASGPLVRSSYNAYELYKGGFSE